MTGDLAKSNPFRFSTKYQDDETDLLYYGYRYYNASTGRWLSRDPVGEGGGVNLYDCVANDLVNDIDYLGTQSPFPAQAKESPKTTELRLWTSHSQEAEWPIDFWTTFFDCRSGKGREAPVLSQNCKQKYLCILRAVSWVESRHGTAGENQPGRDPVQTANPLDQWWKELSGQSGIGSRFIGGPNAKNYWANQLNSAVQQYFNDKKQSCKCDLVRLQTPAAGHNDPNFTSEMSYFWGSLYLMQKINGSPFYNAGSDCPSKDEMIDGAVAYNGGGDPDYKIKIVNALNLIGCMGN